MMELRGGIFDSKILIIRGRLAQPIVPIFIQIDDCTFLENRYMFMLFYEKMIQLSLFQKTLLLLFR